jgi:hypothetical protein
MAPFHDQLPLAVHEVALVLDQVKVELSPAVMEVGAAVNVTAGVPDGSTVN